MWEQAFLPPIRPNKPLALSFKGFNGNYVIGTNVTLVWKEPVYKDVTPVLDYTLYMRIKSEFD